MTTCNPTDLASLTNLLRFASRPGVIDLALGVPEYPPARAMTQAATEAIRTGHNQYVDSWGLPRLRTAVADALKRDHGVEVDAASELTVTCGVAGGVFSTLSALIRPRDEVVVFEPYYGHHIRTIELLKGKPVPIQLVAPNWDLNAEHLRAAIGPQTRAVLLSSPSNPTGRLFSAAELRLVASLCAGVGATLIADEVYADLVYQQEHPTALQLCDGDAQVVVIRGLSKSHFVSGWRIGFVIAPAPLSSRIREVHELATLGAATPLQYGALAAFEPDAARSRIGERYAIHLERLSRSLQQLGCRPTRCNGGIFMLANVSDSPQGDDLSFIQFVLQEAGVLLAPGRLFFADPQRGKQFVRLCFGKHDRTVSAALSRLADLAGG